MFLHQTLFGTKNEHQSHFVFEWQVLATTTATMTFYQRNELQLNEAVASDRLLGPNFAQQGKGEIQVLNLLLHNAGFVSLD